MYIRKNQDYGDSFSKQFKKHGLLSLVIRLEDKLLRLERLSENEAQVKDESIEDTLLDLANYAIMGVMELESKEVATPKGSTYTDKITARPPFLQRENSFDSIGITYE